MKKLFLIFILAFILTGCSSLKECLDDPGCKKDFEEAVAKGAKSGALVGAVGGPGGAAGGGVVGGLLSGWWVVRQFKKKKKEEKENAKTTE